MLKDPMLTQNGAVDDKYHKPTSAGSAVRRMVSSAEVWARNNRRTLVRVVGLVSFVLIVATLAKERNHGAIPAMPSALEQDLVNLGVRGASEPVVAASAEAVSSTRVQTATQETEAEEEEAAASEEEEGDFADEQVADETAVIATESESVATPVPDTKPFAEYTLEELYENWKELQECPDITVSKMTKKAYQWWGLKAYARMYSEHPIKRCVPKLRRHIKLNQDDFEEYYRRWGRPVLFYFDNIRHLGFDMKSYTLDELAELFPYDPAKAKEMTYEANRKYSKAEEIDLGPAIHNFKMDGDLVRQKGGKRNFPRNMKVKPESMSKLGVQIPPLIDMKGATTSQIYQTPSLWMGTSTSGTQFHHDCCDNFVMMIHGTKRFTLAPATDWGPLSPRCVGKAKSLCYANIAEPTADQYSHFNKMVVDVEPGQILYMPAGLFHHIQNLGPTLMTNIWTRGRETIGIMSCNKK
ncbi:HSPB1-associated protein 1-like [Hondaea fermentalgiana]|uniref:HSPB1-associated protein 1-like n=1 Tax=Hondaea fermentalgiana TaxID=2315210 RepID=A0A2R5G527_9STRA|nr:HSPB1-associated protein 1-like [Hondaea fermentalgiana]|eukprot:GBG24888.1 HSPB1-associated protein 1-like [Hondaea fermentalgiana]